MLRVHSANYPLKYLPEFIRFNALPGNHFVTAMALGAKEAVSSIFSSYPSTSIKFHSFNKSLSSVRLGISISPPAASLKFTLYNLPLFSSSQPTKKPGFQLHSTVESASVEEDLENSRKPDNRRKLFVLNLPWSFSVADIKKLFSECGTVADVEVRRTNVRLFLLRVSMFWNSFACGFLPSCKL